MTPVCAPAVGDEQDVLLRHEGGLGRIVLNRPRVINALTHAMVRRIDTALTAWEADDGVRAVVISGTGERGLCAGGDIRGFHADASTGTTASLDFWRDEYALDAHIARYAKPYVAIMDGIVMGGGVGVSAHGGVRVVTERTRLAMPEVGIGLVPDVGGTFLLSRAPGELGTHLALTASAVGAGDAIACGLADHFVPSDRLPGFLDALAVDVDDAVRAFGLPAPPADLVVEREWIDRCYAADTVEE
ncbi:MAG TPA: 3-hydroxyisobutyryl-CoA hydrolase, partial [Umezawaea sp.]|nr:3-hydroxyisobutyryl-CoA hydrolase [Umezawaea sp.]